MIQLAMKQCCIDVKIQNVRKRDVGYLNLGESCIDVKIQNVRKLSDN